MVAALDLGQAQARFFRLLVRHDQASDPEEREALHERLCALRRVRHRKRLGIAQANYYDHWYYPALRNLAPHVSCPDDPARIGALLDPPVTGSEATKALHDLVQMGLLAHRDGRWHATDSVINVDLLPHSAKSKGRHDILQKGIESLHRFAADERFARCTLLALDDQGWEEVRSILDDAARRCLEVSARDQKPRRIAQAVVQLFPLSRKLPT